MIYVYRIMGFLIGIAIYFIIINSITISVPASWVLYLVLICSGTFIGERLFYRSKKEQGNNAQTPN